MDKERILTTEAQAKAVREVGFLGQFCEPTSPSDASKRLGQPANLVHHHAQRHLGLGLLEEVGRENGKVLYRLTAQHFKVPRGLLPPGDPDNKVARDLERISKQFLAAYERSDRISDDEDPNFDHYSFGVKGSPEPSPTLGEPLEPRAAHYQARTLALTPKSYQRFVRMISDMLSDADSERDEVGSGLCTLVFISMDGALQPGTRNAQQLSSFVPPLKETV